MKIYTRQNDPFSKETSLESIRFALMNNLKVTAKRSPNERYVPIDKSHIGILDEELKTSIVRYQYQIPFQLLSNDMSKFISKRYKLEVVNSSSFTSKNWEILNPKLKIPAIQANHTWTDIHGVYFSVFELHSGLVKRTSEQTQHYTIESTTTEPWQ